MPQGGDQPQQKRRSRTTGSNSAPLSYSSMDRKDRTALDTGYDEDDDYLEESPRQNASATRYHTTQSQRLPPNPHPPTTSIPRRQAGMTRELPLRSMPRPMNTTSQYLGSNPVAKARLNVHWLLPLGVGMVAMLVLWVFGSLVVAWGAQRYDDITYGNPRTYHTDAVVGHNGDNNAHPSHFVAMNLHRQAVVIELMAGDPAKSVSYVVPYYIVGDNSDLTPVTVSFKDVTGNHRLDMIIHIHLHSQDQTFVFVNDGTKFRPPTDKDKIQLN